MIVIETDMKEMPKGCAGCPVATEETVRLVNGSLERVPYCKAINKFTECFMWQRPDWCPLREVKE